MKPRFPEVFDAIVVGAGHAGCEAAMALSRMGCKTLLLTMNVDHIGQLSCNPAIGGLAKGHMVREIDALGGMMGLWADAAGIQFRTLNTRKGPAVQATRAQIDRSEYMRVVKRDIFSQDSLWVWQDTGESLMVEKGRCTGIVTKLGERFRADNVLLTTGTFLHGLLHIGLKNFSGGRLGDPSAEGMSACLRELGFELGRLKTGTTPRLLKASIDFDKMDVQFGDDPPPAFSFRTTSIPLPQRPCHMTWTNADAHEAIRSGFDRSPMFTGVIEGTGARYCPSIEDKVARFPDKERHQIFVEPEGLDHPEVYPNGIPTSLPLDVQKKMINACVGLENAQIVRPGYAIEYDFVPPTQLRPTLESKLLPGLWCAGQINGTSGYEEAAAQGLWAAMNIHAAKVGLEPFLPGRDQAYMAVLVDDLVTKGTREPYRMFTSRAEHRLLLREGNADLRLTELGRKHGLVDDAQWTLFSQKSSAVQQLLDAVSSVTVRPNRETAEILESIGATVPGKAVPLTAILRQPDVGIRPLAALLPLVNEVSDPVLDEVETQVRYEGYLKRQQELVDRFRLLENVAIPESIDYAEVAGLTREAVEKLGTIHPMTLGQASRISGITPATISCLEVHMKKAGYL